jgi:hypothetical protein
MVAMEAIKDIPLEDVTSRIIRYQDAMLAAEAKNSAPYIAMGRRAFLKMRQREALRRRWR